MSTDRNNVTFKQANVSSSSDSYSFGDKCVIISCFCAGVFVLVLELLGMLENL